VTLSKDKIAVLGLGYVGLPLALRFANTGKNVIGIDIDPLKVDSLQRGASYIKHIPSRDVHRAIEQGRFECSTNFARVQEVSAVIICVPTPLNAYREPDLSFVLNTGRAVAPYLQKGVVVILESTTYPGTTEVDLRAVLEAGSSMKAGTDFHLAFSPEREDPGNPESSLEAVPKLIGGLTEKCLHAAVKVYEAAANRLVPVDSCRIAEAAKLTENIFRSVNIALVNELKVIYERMGIDIWKVIDAAKTKPFGFMAFYPGPGLGGHCIPIDPFYLTWKAREFGLHTRFIELAGEINTGMPQYVVEKIADALNTEGKPLKGSEILLLGLAYKPNIEDDRESPSYVIMELLEKKGAKVYYNDPHIPKIKHTRHHDALAGRQSVAVTDACDAVVICTAHDEYKSMDFSRFAIPVIDTRNCVSKRNRKYYRA
jgi:UDP-N-acetyl-D-glucosamine dehydrogenase